MFSSDYDLFFPWEYNYCHISPTSVAIIAVFATEIIRELKKTTTTAITVSVNRNYSFLRSSYCDYLFGFQNVH